MWLLPFGMVRLWLKIWYLTWFFSQNDECWFVHKIIIIKIMRDNKRHIFSFIIIVSF